MAKPLLFAPRSCANIEGCVISGVVPTFPWRGGGRAMEVDLLGTLKTKPRGEGGRPWS